MPVWRKTNVLLRRWFRNMVRLHSTPKQIALGFAVGLFVGWTPTMGVQMIGAAFIATLIGANRIAAMAGVWFTNYLTAIPLYGFAWWLGDHVLTSLGFIHRPESWRHIVRALRHFFHKPWKEQLVGGMKAYGEMWVGCVILGIISAVIGYYVMLWLVEGRRAAVAKRRAEQAQGSSGPSAPSERPDDSSGQAQK